MRLYDYNNMTEPVEVKEDDIIRNRSSFLTIIFFIKRPQL